MLAPFHNVWRRFQTKPLRTGLTLLQVALGALAMTVAVTAYLGSFVDRTTERFIFTSGSKESGVWQVMVADKVPELLELAPAVETLALMGDSFQNEIRYQGESYVVTRITRVMPDFFWVAGIELTRGAFFTQREFEAQEAVALVSDRLAEDLFGGEPIGQEFTVLPEPGLPGGNGRTYRVIGTYAYRTLGREERALRSRLGPIYIPISPLDGSEGEAGSYLVLAKPGQGELAREQLMAAANVVYRDWQGIRLLEEGNRFFIEELAESFRYADSLNPNVIIFGLFGIIALIIGAIGVYSSITVDVAERSHEIGVRRTLGASRARIAREFMGEAAVVALLGGVLGVALAAAVLPLLLTWVGNTLFSGVRLEFEPMVGLGVLVLILALGAVLGLLPAVQATRLKPVEALAEV